MAKVRGFQALKRSKAIELTRQMDQREGKGEGGLIANSRVYAYKLAHVFVSFVSRSSKRIHIDTRLFRNVVNTIAAFDLFHPFSFSLFPHVPPSKPCKFHAIPNPFAAPYAVRRLIRK